MSKLVEAAKESLGGEVAVSELSVAILLSFRAALVVTTHTSSLNWLVIVSHQKHHQSVLSNTPTKNCLVTPTVLSLLISPASSYRNRLREKPVEFIPMH